MALNMTRRGFLLSAALAQPRRNVLFLVADDLNNALGCYGNKHVKTPNFDKLAARGVLFERAYCQFPLCAPSRASFLSGLRPETTRVLSLDVPTRRHMPDAVMLPELFRKNGYHTSQSGKIFHTGPEHEDPRSWDTMHIDNGKNPPVTEAIRYDTLPKPRNHSMTWMELRTPEEQTPDAIAAAKASESIRHAVRTGRPFFAAVGFRRPHSPYAVPKRYFDLYDPPSLPLPDPASTHPPAARYELPETKPLTAKEQREFLAAYYASVSYADAQAGRIFQTLEELDLWENTVVVLIGDHGYHNGDHAMWHKMTLFETSHRVPFLLYAPDAKGNGRRSKGLVELLDVYPTLAGLCGLTSPRNLEGVNLRPWLDEPARPSKPAAFGMVGRNDDGHESHHNPTYFGKTIRTESWRYTEWDEGRRGAELYDEQKDPGETKNLIGDAAHGPVIQELKQRLRNRQ